MVDRHVGGSGGHDGEPDDGGIVIKEEPITSSAVPNANDSDKAPVVVSYVEDTYITTKEHEIDVVP